jgi:hypothetical protein
MPLKNLSHGDLRIPLGNHALYQEPHGHKPHNMINLEKEDWISEGSDKDFGAPDCQHKDQRRDRPFDE